MDSYSADQVWIYILDFGSEALKIFRGSPNVGDIVFMEDSEKTERFFQMIQNEIQNRKEVLSNFNGDIGLYRKTSGEKMPTILTIINNFEGFSELYQDKYEDIIANVTREGTKFGINFILSASAQNSLRYRLSQNFKQKIALQLNNDDDYFNIFDVASRKRPSRLFGRGLIEIDRQIYEFQTAKICAPEEYNTTIKEKIEETQKTNKTHAKPIPVMPSVVLPDELNYKISSIRKIPIGINKYTLNVETYNFTNNFVNVISTKDLDSTAQFISSLAGELEQVKGYKIEILDAERIIQTKKEKLMENYSELVNEINTNIKVICIIVGIERFLNELNRGDTEFAELLKKTEEIGGYNFIIVDTSTKLKNHEFDQWYKKYISNDTGIWVGNGADNQFTIRINSLRRDIVNNCGASFGYVIDQGEATMLKFLGIIEKGDENG